MMSVLQVLVAASFVVATIQYQTYDEYLELYNKNYDEEEKQ